MSKIDLDNYIDFMVEYKKEISKEYEEEIERLNNKLLKIKELINRTPRQTPKEIAYIMLKSEIAEVIEVDKDD